MRFSHVLMVIFGHILYVVALREINSHKSQQPTYLFTYPQLMIAGSYVKACLTLYNFKLPVTVRVVFTRNRCSSSRQTGCKNEFKIVEAHQCVNLETPKFFDGVVYDALEISIEGDQGKTTKKGRKDAVIFSKREVMFVETDRTIYKPEDEIRIRLLALQFSLTPVETITVANVVLYGPNGIKVRQFPNVTIAAGVAEVTYKLQQDAHAGFWKLEVNGLMKATFQVKRYIQARFRTTLNHPQQFFWGDTAVMLSICSIYTYKEPVQGIGTIETVVRSNDGKEQSPVNKTGKLINGCMEMELHTKQLVLSNVVLQKIEITGIVVEDGTNVTVTKTGSMIINSVSYDMINEPHKLKPGLPYSSHLHIRDKNVLVTEQNVTICYTHKEYSTPQRVCKMILTKNENVIPFTIPPLKKVQHPVVVEAFIQNIEDKKYYSRPSMRLQPSYSIMNNSLSIMPLDKDIWRCGDQLKFNVMYTVNNINHKQILFNYILVSRYDVIQAGYKLISPNKTTFDPEKFKNVLTSSDNHNENNIQFDYFTIDVTLSGRVYSDVKFIVFFVANGEVIADDISLSIEKCLPNRVAIQWEKTEVEPNMKTKLKIASTRGSICAITATDISSSFTGSSNMLTPQDILLPFEILEFQALNTNERTCVIPADYDGPSANVIWFNTIHTDANTVFEQNKVGVISNVRLISRPCSSLVVDTKKTYQSETKRLSDEPEDRLTYDSLELHRLAIKDMSLTRARTHFPQTWLWDVLIISDPETVYEVSVPSSITRWVTNVLCLNSLGGIGVSRPTELVVKKALFMELILPYSVKRNIESVHMLVVLHNYFNYSVPIVIKLQPSKFIRIIEEVSNNVTYCVQSRGMVTHTFTFRGLQVGIVNVSVIAEVVPKAVASCGNGEINNATDNISRSIKVIPEAYEEHTKKSALLCAGDWGKADEISWQLTIPEDQMVMNVEAGVTIDSNIFTPLIENVEAWIQAPAGTAEDIISAVASNFYALEYIKTNHLESERVAKIAKENLQIGAKKLYGFFRNDGVFAVKENSNTLGTIFMTAFVLRLLKLIGAHISIENAIIIRAIAGLLMYQKPNGCFNVLSHEEVEPQTTSLTSFVMISLLEAGADIAPEQKVYAKQCILEETNLDKYGMAISTYALFLMGEEEHASSNLKTLIENAERSGNLMYWHEKNVQQSDDEIDVEVSGYVLMSLLRKSTPEYINYARLIVRWLLTDPQHGHYSTQDIVVTLDGISRFSNVVNTNSSKLILTVGSNANGETKFNLQPGVEHVTEVINIRTLPDIVNVRVTGYGCVLVKSSVEFNTYSSNMVFDMHSKIADMCKCTIDMTSCVSTNSTERSGIAVLKILIPPGYAVNQTSLVSLEKQTSGVKKYEYVDHVVALYFADTSRGKKCATFTIQETVEVQHRTNITMKVYSYYAADAAMQHSYLLPSCKYPDKTDTTKT